MKKSELFFPHELRSQLTIHEDGTTTVSKEMMQEGMNEQQSLITRMSAYHQALQIAEQEIDDKEKDLKAMVDQIFKEKLYLQETPFIPEDCGFVPETFQVSEESLPVRAYKRGDKYLVRNPAVPQAWNVNGEQMVIITNMYEAMIVLRALGFDPQLEELPDDVS